MIPERAMHATAEELRCEWSVHSCSSETEVHEAANALKSELYRVWQTAQPVDEAWLILEACPPSAFSRMDIVNAGSALVEVFGLPDDNPHGDDHQFIMLLSAQQLMSTKDVIGKANRNRSFAYDCSNKLSRLAAQHRWKQIKVICRQPFGSEEQKTCIGLSRLTFKICRTSAEVAADAAEAHLQQNLKAGVAKMFPKGLSSAEDEVISQVTEPSKCKVEQKVTRGGEAGTSSPGKRKLPVWQSPSKHTKKEAKKAEAAHGALSSEDGEEISESFEEVSLNRKSMPKISKSEINEPEGTSSISVKQQDKEGDDRRRKSTGSYKNKGHPHELSKGPSTQRKKGSEQGSGECSPRPGTKQHSRGQLSQTAGSLTVSTTEGRSSPGLHQTSKPPATLKVFDQPESSRKKPSGQVDPQVQRGHGKEAETQSKLSVRESNETPSLQSSSRVHETRQPNAITHSFSKFLSGVVFAISGLVNPERAELRDKALEMGGQYRPDWSSDCTLLICAFANTPKFNQVKNDNGTIVSKAWIKECYQQKKLVEIEKYLMHAGKPWRQIEESAVDELDEESGLGCDGSTTLGSLRDLQHWVSEDVATSITWLKQQETQPEAAELKSVAIQGIQLCLDDTIECLKSKQSIKKIMESWDYVPRAVRELAGREEKAGSTKKKNFWSDMLSEAERLKWIYAKELEKMKRTEESVVDKYGKQRLVVDEDDAMDASTDVMSDDSSSDDTQVLDEEEIREAEEAISKILSDPRRK